MPHYRAVGTIPRKRHTKARADDGSVLFEELIGTEGFSRESALLYHRCSPSAILGVEPVDLPDPAADDGIGPRHLRTGDLAPGPDLVTGRHRLAGNADVTLAFVRSADPSPLHRSVVGDELVYVHDGTARLESVFGALDVGAGDYVVVPAGVTHRWVPDGEVAALVLESSGHVRIPDKYLSPHGQLLEGAPFSERDLRAPTEPLHSDGTEVPVLVRTRSGWLRYIHATHPFDVVGWDGCVYPHALSIHEFEPIVGRIHQPPPVHQTWALPGAVVCSFVPRPYDFDPDAVRVPYHHHNVDSDEVLFYAEGDFMSRSGSGIGRGSISLHPAGFTHGPQPGSSDKADAADGTNEVAVMLDTFRPLQVYAAAAAVEDEAYWGSWSGR
ncbi:homogentisate 1,2-dioxygenase [Actinomarinicola tropica]|uniref:Homogentisate 1,2-dioxygenase n=1 Tax=Actinomarinicola tropica TaxID=2789776 RepID=A0A5Q2RK30_9ACTN|nr:cupin domain-containing protein [Actinomarinicola tropica]QGG94210.1 homogentisate 1,2-dioxygenase [Actinomarinicola tropica]